MLELLSPAGSPEAVIAAVQNGADAVYLGYEDFNAQRGAVNFSDTELENAARYCRVRDCRVYVTFNSLVSDREMSEVSALAVRAARAGADAFIVGDYGVARMLRGVLPDIPLFASVHLDIHDTAGVKAAAELGFSRVILSRELSLDRIRAIAAASPIELGVFVHGNMCVSHCGQCYMSALSDGSSANRGLCTRPCLQDLSLGGRMDDHPLSLKESCLIRYLGELRDAGICCVKLEGRESRPEYAAAVTAMYSAAIRDGSEPTEDELRNLTQVFAGNGYTDGYLTGKLGPDMFAPPGGTPDKDGARFISDIRKGYSDGELRRAPVKFYVMMRKGESSKFIAEDSLGNRSAVLGPLPVPAVGTSTTPRALSEILYKTGGTPYICAKVTSAVDPDIYLPDSAIADARQKLLSKLSELRRAGRDPKCGHTPVINSYAQPEGGPKRIFQVSTAAQLTPELAACKPDYIYVPLEILSTERDRLIPFARNGAIPVAVLPHVIYDDETDDIRAMLHTAYDMGVRQALINSMGHIVMARSAGFDVRADFGFNAFNSQTLQTLANVHFLSATVSFELALSQIRSLKKPLDTEMIVYGRLPVMITDNCLIRNSSGHCSCHNPTQISDSKGGVFPVVRDFKCRNVVYSSRKIFLADKQRNYSDIGLWGARLLFTTESSRECAEVAKSYLRLSAYRPNGLSRGRYTKGVL